MTQYQLQCLADLVELRIRRMYPHLFSDPQSAAPQPQPASASQPMETAPCLTTTTASVIPAP